MGLTKKLITCRIAQSDRVANRLHPVKSPIPPTSPDVVLVGAGIMSATLGTLLKELQPDLTIEIFESLPGAA
jgi:hypothetical protein